jgi:hypothetical protein
MKLRKILFPFSILYGLITAIQNFLLMFVKPSAATWPKRPTRFRAATVRRYSTALQVIESIQVAVDANQERNRIYFCKETSCYFVRWCIPTPKVQGGLYIEQYNDLYCDDYMLPTGKKVRVEW